MNIMDNNPQYLPSIQSLHPSQGSQVQVIQLTPALSTSQSLQDQQKQQQSEQQQQHDQQEQEQSLSDSNSPQNESAVSNSSKGNVSSTTLRRGPWSQEEDRLLLDAIAMFGPSNWVRNSQALGSRTPKQCRERYHQNLKPSLNRNPITPEEGRLIEELVAKYGKRWAEIARHLNGRSDNAIKNWWNGGSNRRRRASLQAMVTPNNLQTLQPLSNNDCNVDSQPAFNTTMFQPEQQLNNNNLLPPHVVHNQIHPLAQHQVPLSHSFAQQMLPPLTNSRSSSITQEHFQQQPGVKRLLDEQNFLPERRHSAQTILTTTGSSPFSMGRSSRNSSFSNDWNHTNNTPLSTSRRSSLAQELFPSSFQQQAARRSSHFSPTVQSARSSISGLSGGLTPLSVSQYPQAAQTQNPPLPNQPNQSNQPNQLNQLNQQQQQQDSDDKNLFKSNFDFSSKRKESIKLPPPSSLHSIPSIQSVPNSNANSNSNTVSNSNSRLGVEPVRYQIPETYRNSISNEPLRWGNNNSNGNDYYKFQNVQQPYLNHLNEYKTGQTVNNLNGKINDKENKNNGDDMFLRKDYPLKNHHKEKSGEVGVDGEGEGEGEEKMNINNLLS